ncbi:MAG: DUF1015 family protein [Defluviitaleaceae bacterium]|nr:DUF1015 family protein [Defluviitaleaceae bacterium]
MSKIIPLRALRPKPEFAAKVAALPYDVMNTDEAREMSKDNPLCFLNITRSEINLPDGADPYADEVYNLAAEYLKKLEMDGVLMREDKPCYYIYAQTMGGRTQTGIVAGASIDEYFDGRIKKHELTREAKEVDRIRHMEATNANTGLIFLAHKPEPEITALIKWWTERNEPEISFTPDDGVTHSVWVVTCDGVIAELRSLFEKLNALYIADGHHRNASAAKVAQKKRAANPNYTGEEDFNYYMAAIFSSDELMIMDYNRIISDLNGHSTEGFLAKVGEKFSVSPRTSTTPIKPRERHVFGMYINKEWYEITIKPEYVDEADPVARLDCDILQKHLLAPILGIEDVRTNPNIEFAGGLRGLDYLAEQVEEQGGKGVAFALFPTSMDELIDIADSGQIMPPKSTWFEPKLRSGLFVHTL